jgi:MYXO-CTERM domain-containing protein
MPSWVYLLVAAVLLVIIVAVLFSSGSSPRLRTAMLVLGVPLLALMAGLGWRRRQQSRR